MAVKLPGEVAFIFYNFLKLATFPIFSILKMNCGVYSFMVGVFIEKVSESDQNQAERVSFGVF